MLFLSLIAKPVLQYDINLILLLMITHQILRQVKGGLCILFCTSQLCPAEAFTHHRIKDSIANIWYLQQRYSGTIVDDQGNPLANATIKNLQQNIATQSNEKGEFVLQGKPGETLEFTYTGFATLSYTLTAEVQLSIKMNSSDQSVEEVVIMGYNSLKETNVSGAISRVDMQVAEKRRVQDVSQMLQGAAAGVNVTQASGQPGDPINIRVRGVGTIGNNSPLFVVDGIPTTNFSFINPNDIESMSVLKDASAASIYGSRAAAGVILVTTKKGFSGKPTFNVNVFSGIQRVTNLPEMMNATQYMNTMEKAWANSNSSGTNPYTAEKASSALSNTNWLNELFETGKTNSFQIGASGGSDKVTYRLATGYYSQDGILKFDNDRYQRLEFRSNVSAQLHDRVKLSSNILLNHQDRMVASSRGDSPGIIRHALLRPPILGVYKDSNDPTYNVNNPFTDLPFYEGPTSFKSTLYEWSRNPVAAAYFSNNRQKQFKLFGNVEGSVDILADRSLKFRSVLGVELNFNHDKAFLANYGDNDGGGEAIDAGMGRHNRPNGLDESRGEDYTMTWNNVLSYDKQWEDHQINALVGTEFIVNNTNSINGSRRRFEYESDRFHYLDLGGIDRDLWNGGFAQEWGLFSVFTSATYAYKSRYTLTANLRADASSRFGSDNKWGYFPSLSAGWVVSNEPFFEPNNIISYLKLRASTGTLGNQNIANYAYITLFSREGNITRYGNPSLRWESTTQHNVGLDMRLLNNKLDITADYFRKDTKDILLLLNLPSFVGNVDPTYVNAGQISNEGWELNARYRESISEDFSFSIGGNITRLRNSVSALHPNVPRIVSSVSRVEPGHPLDAYYGYVMDGIYQNQSEIVAHQHGVATPLSKPGDIRFKDLNGDGLINDDDRTYIGNPIPKWSYGFNGEISFKNFDFSVFFQGVKDVDRYNDGMRIVDFDSRPFNYTTRMLDAWDGEGSSNSLPRVAFEETGVSRFSSLYIEDASYLRLKNMEVGYSFRNLPKNWGVSNARVYVSGQNLYTWTNYRGLDPETTDLIDRGTYPQAKTFLVGLNLNF